MTGQANEPHLDRFHWAGKVSRRDIQRLDQSDAAGRLDEALLDRAVHGMHGRILDMFEVRQAQQHGLVRCRSCGEFFDSYNGKDLLTGSRPDVFLGFLARWPSAHSTQGKMLLVDWLIHEFHAHAGIAGRPAARNVIQGSDRQVRELLDALAAGPASTAGLTDRQAWAQAASDPIRAFRQSHSWAKCQAIAAQLNISGRTTMRQDDLLAELYRRAPELFEDIQKTS